MSKRKTVITQAQTCENCDGHETFYDEECVDCDVCGGTGIAPAPDDPCPHDVPQGMTCNLCDDESRSRLDEDETDDSPDDYGDDTPPEPGNPGAPPRVKLADGFQTLEACFREYVKGYKHRYPKARLPWGRDELSDYMDETKHKKATLRGAIDASHAQINGGTHA